MKIFCPIVAAIGFLLSACDQVPQDLELEEKVTPKPQTFTNGIGQKMIWVPAGSFWMADQMNDDVDYEKPERRVGLSCYYLGATEVTQGQWDSLMVNNPSHFRGADLPVDGVSWTEAMGFCTKLNRRESAADRLPEGYIYTLPSEAQWEYACRAGTVGSDGGNLKEMAWHKEDSAGKSHPVATKKPNAWGFYDMHGNVKEWCRDRTQVEFLTGKVRVIFEDLGTKDPVGKKGDYRVLRGGSWFNDLETDPRFPRRDFSRPEARISNGGFRVVAVEVSADSQKPDR